MSTNLSKELELYFLGKALKEYPESRICPLSMDESIRRHKEFIEFDPIYEELGLVPLDDANDSNSYCYVLKTPMKGCIFHYSHDGDRLFKFSTLDSWVESLNKAGKESKDIDDVDYEKRVDSKDVPGLCNYIESTYDKDSDYYSEGTVYLIQGLDERCIGLVEKLSTNGDFFIREAVAQLISDKPNKLYREVALKLSSDGYEQVSRPAKDALKKINAMI
ncbi:hypothetical protein [Ketobacter alkanivorans]|uniref:Uncharacterized protein n=1 Tax=Ketobacter alkanivorans TaxID=1917421 RepID=A0A2K9LR14_9GAMM|nr:hypothetical protein [Ketobacter alkanivorans]AUM14707.1 hypothetical protein Kalk_20740 [Ketobacter alkanivorans]